MFGSGWQGFPVRPFDLSPSIVSNGITKLDFINIRAVIALSPLAIFFSRCRCRRSLEKWVKLGEVDVE